MAPGVFLILHSPPSATVYGFDSARRLLSPAVSRKRVERPTFSTSLSVFPFFHFFFFFSLLSLTNKKWYRYSAGRGASTAGKKTAIIVTLIVVGVLVVAAAVTAGILLSSSSGATGLQRSATNEFLVAHAGFRADGVTPRVLARSYGGNAWELVPDLDFPQAALTCDAAGNCQLEGTVR
jgi:hypothetical protein